MVFSVRLSKLARDGPRFEWQNALLSAESVIAEPQSR